MIDETGVTLGEVWRNMEELKGDVKEMGRDVTEIKTVQANFVGSTSAKVDRLEKIVYGSLGVAISAFIAAMTGILTK